MFPGPLGRGAREKFFGRRKEKTVDTALCRCYDVLKYFPVKGAHTMSNLYAANFFSYFYFFGFGADKVKVLFAA